jgi:hypothetical protein
MSATPTDQIVETLVADARPVRTLAPPFLRALLVVTNLVLFMGLAVAAGGDVGQLLLRYAGREEMLAWEMTSMMATGVLAVTAAFFLSVPGRSRLWFLVPMPTLLAWLLLSGLGCYQQLLRSGASGWELGESFHCLLFIVGTSILIGGPVAWRLSKARPVDPLPVALAGGLGTAAFCAFLLQFFHPFAVTFLDLGLHFTGILLVVAGAALLRGRALRPA